MQSSAKIKVTHILTDSNIGGAGRLLRYFLEKADRERFEYSVILPDDAALIPEIEALGIPVHTVRGIADRSNAPEAKAELIEILKMLSPDILHTHSSRTGRFAGIEAGIPVIMLSKHCSDMPPERLTKFPMKQIAAREWKKSLHGAIATDDSAADSLAASGLSRSKIKVIYNGAPALRETSEEEKKALRKELNIPDNAFVVGIFARLEPVKDHLTLLEAARRGFYEELEDVYYLIVGEGGNRSRIEFAAEDEMISDKVRICGFCDDIAPLMNICDVNVNCSVGTETSNLAIIEGMSLGVVPVVSDLEGNKRLADGCGIICRQKRPEEFLRAIKSLFDDREKLSELSSAAKEKYYSRYTSERMAREVEEYYLQLIK